MEYSTTTEIAKRWNISSRRVRTLCMEGSIDGAIKKGKMWLIPSDAKKLQMQDVKQRRQDNEQFYFFGISLE